MAIFILEQEGFAREEFEAESIDAYFKSLGLEVPERWKQGREATKEEVEEREAIKRNIEIAEEVQKLISTEKGLAALKKLIEG